MEQLFELSWMGGAAEHFFRKARPGIDDLPWGTLDVRADPPETVDAARAMWTECAFTEYRAVAAFSEIVRLLCEAKAPLDLIGMASGFVADEVVHVELASRVAMELGGGVPRPTDYESLFVRPDPALSPFQRANELVMRISSIAEAYSGRMAVGALSGATHPLTRAVYARIVADESLHHRLGGLYFDWASEQLDGAERARLSGIALDTLRSLSTTWRRPAWKDARGHAARVAAAVKDAIVAPLRSYGLELRSEDVDALLI